MNPVLRPFPLVGRVLIAPIFVLAGIAKIDQPAVTAGYMASHGIPMPDVLVYGVIALELIGGLMLMAGLYARWAAYVLFLYTLSLAVIFHPYWVVPPAQAAIQHAMFFENLSMMGGMLFVVAFGAGPISVDALRRRDVADWGSDLANTGRRPVGRMH